MKVFCYSSALPTWFGLVSVWYSEYDGVSVGGWLYCTEREDRTFLATKTVQFMTILQLNDCEGVRLCLFVDVFNLMDTRHTEGRVLEVTSWITSFRPVALSPAQLSLTQMFPQG